MPTTRGEYAVAAETGSVFWKCPIVTDGQLEKSLSSPFNDLRATGCSLGACLVEDRSAAQHARPKTGAEVFHDAETVSKPMIS
jgi:hypothetical protein